MKRLLILIVVLLAGCGESEDLIEFGLTDDEVLPESINEPIVKQPSIDEIIKEVNASGAITDDQAESLSKVEYLYLNGLTSITDEQAESLGKTGSLELKGLTSITDTQAKSLRKIPLGLVISDACYDVVSRYMKFGLTKASERKY